MSKSKASPAPAPRMINDNNLSRAWSRLLLGVLDGAGTEVSPLVLSLTGFDEKGAVPEDPARAPSPRSAARAQGQDSRSRCRLHHLPSATLGDVARRPHPPFRTLSCDIPALAGDEQESERPRPIFRAHGDVRPRAVRRQSTGVDIVTVRFASGRASLNVPGDNVRSGARSCRERAARFSLPTASQLRADDGGPRRERLLCNPANLRQSLWQLSRPLPSSAPSWRTRWACPWRG